MKKFLLVCLLMAFFSPFAMAEEGAAGPEAQCRKMAEEANVSADEMEDYVQNCIREATSSGE